MGRYVLDGKVISGSNIGKKLFISRLSLTPSNRRISFQFQRRQISIVVCFAMTINKGQGKSLKQICVYLLRSVFSQGQPYIVISRVTSRNSCKFYWLMKMMKALI
jgi:ATP-dependent exoDNAse (exonuclease V) alpha subunit